MHFETDLVEHLLVCENNTLRTVYNTMHGFFLLILNIPDSIFLHKRTNKQKMFKVREA